MLPVLPVGDWLDHGLAEVHGHFAGCPGARQGYGVGRMTQSQIQEPIASVSFIWVDAKGAERPVTGIVGKPYQKGADEWACPYVVEGATLDQGPDISSGDSIQALSLALYGLYHDLIGSWATAGGC